MAHPTYTVYDIAQMAGVSPATVSRVLTGVVRVSPEKEARIRKVMQEVNFRPNASARTLLSKRSMTIGVVLPDITNLFFSQTFLELERAALRAGYHLLLGNTLNSDRIPERDLETYYLNSLHERQVDGIILMGGRIDDDPMSPQKRDELLDLDATTPLVTVNGRIPDSPIPSVRSDEAGGIVGLVEHLLGQGHRRFALIGGIEGISAFNSKRSALEAALKDRGLNLDDEWVFPTGFSLEDGTKAMTALIARKERPTAILGINDLVAMGAIRRATSAGFRVPADFAVTGFDDILISPYFVPSLTSVNQNYETLAETAIKTLIGRIEGTEFELEAVVPTKANFRESSRQTFAG